MWSKFERTIDRQCEECHSATAQTGVFTVSLVVHRPASGLVESHNDGALPNRKRAVVDGSDVGLAKITECVLQSFFDVFKHEADIISERRLAVSQGKLAADRGCPAPPSHPTDEMKWRNLAGEKLRSAERATNELQ
jgi:hypothetical protein